MYSRSDEAREYRKLYDSKRWRETSRWQLRTSPLCSHCLEQDRITAATVADHIEPHRGDLAKFFDPANVQSLCDSCHSGWKQQLERTGIGRGCDVDGVPSDPKHHWRNGEGG